MSRRAPETPEALKRRLDEAQRLLAEAVELPIGPEWRELLDRAQLLLDGLPCDLYAHGEPDPAEPAWPLPRGST